ncbi:MAG: tetratricopeptide repeat protein [Planctomycetaceae bacterium]
MSSAVYVLTVAVCLAQSSSGKVIPNLDRFVTRDWSSEVDIDSRGTTTLPYDGDWKHIWRMLSLRPSEKSYAEGTAWLWVMTKATDYENPTARFPRVDYTVNLEVYKGTYVLLTRKGETDSIILRVAFTRTYRSPLDDDRVQWTMNTRYLPEGADFILNLDDSGRIPEQEVTLSLERFFYVDNEGREMIRRYEPSTFTERLIGEGSVKTLRRVQFASAGESIRMQPGDTFQKDFKADPPPAYRFREPVTVTAAKPTPVDALTETWRLADAARDNEEYERAEILYAAAIEMAPTRATLYGSRAICRMERKEWAQAITDLSQAIALDPKMVEYRSCRASCHELLGHEAEVIVDWKALVELQPKDAKQLNELAWRLATSNRATIRNGPEAVKYAERACKETGFQNGMYIDTLAAACAESGDFPRAVRLQTVAIELLDAAEKVDATKRLDLYQRRKPFREE